VRLNRVSQDTAAGCREHAAGDLARAAELSGGMSRQRMLDSAAAWTARAELLERLQEAFLAGVPQSVRGRRKSADRDDQSGSDTVG
jgi:hypothetical protein